MVLRRIPLALLLIALIATACSGDDGDESGGAQGVSLHRQIGAPSSEFFGDETDPSVVKRAAVEMDVPEKELNSAAQAVVDLATSPRIGGFLVSSVVDLERGSGLGKVVVKVPSQRFEPVVGELDTIGQVTRQQLEGQDLTAKVLNSRQRVRRARARTASLLQRLDESTDETARFELREELLAAKDRLRKAKQNESFIGTEVAYSEIGVALRAEPPPAPPEKPAMERALENAKTTFVAIASGAVLTAGVVVPVGLLLLVVYVLGALLLRRLKPRLEHWP